MSYLSWQFILEGGLGTFLRLRKTRLYPSSLLTWYVTWNELTTCLSFNFLILACWSLNSFKVQNSCNLILNAYWSIHVHELMYLISLLCLAANECAHHRASISRLLYCSPWTPFPLCLFTPWACQFCHVLGLLCSCQLLSGASKWHWIGRKSW